MTQIVDYFTDYSFWVNFSKNSVLKRLRSIKWNVEYFQKWFTISTFMVYIYSVLKWRISGEMPLEKVKFTRRFTLLIDASVDGSTFWSVTATSYFGTCGTKYSETVSLSVKLLMKICISKLRLYGILDQKAFQGTVMLVTTQKIFLTFSIILMTFLMWKIGTNI